MPERGLDPATTEAPVSRPTPRRTTGMWRAQVGDVLGGRYRLTALAATGATELWKAQDDVLARQVAVRLFSDPQASAAQRAGFVRAAAAAGQVVGSGIASVFDAATEPSAPRPGEDERQIGAPVSYVVAEWVEGRALGDRLRDGSLGVDEACALVSDLCTSVQGAHQQQIFAGRLHPGQVLITPAGKPKLTDLAVASAVHDRDAAPRVGDSAAREDTRGLARILYAAVTGCWPDPGWPQPWSGLPAAPLKDGRLCLPRQVKAGLPRELDLVIARTLEPQRRPTDPPITHPRELRDALAELSTTAVPRAVAPIEERPLSTESRPRRRRRWPLILIAIVWLVLLGTTGALSGLVIGRVPGTTVSAPKIPGVHPAASGAANATPLVAANVNGFDPQGDKRENESEVPDATDGDPTTAWDTEQYDSATFGNLKTGVGLLVDLGTAHSISHVTVRAPAGEQLELLAATGSASAPTSDKETTVAAGPVTVTDSAKDTVLMPASAVTSRWFVVWITTLPPSATSGGAKDAFSGQIAEMSFFG